MTTTSAPIASERGIPDWIKHGFLTTTVFAMCWGGAIAYWRTTRSNPASSELLIYLLGLPSCLLLVFFVSRKALTKSSGTSSSAVLSTPATAAPMSPQTSPLAILATSLRIPHGVSCEELSAAIVDNKARPDLDRELVDDEGFPVMTARSNEAVDEELKEEVTEWLALNGMAELEFSDEQWRAVTLASAVVEELASQAAGPILYQVDAQTQLQLIPILPTDWEAMHRRAAAMWLKQTVARYGWPADRVIVTADDTTPHAVFNRLSHDALATQAPLIAMVVASASHVGDATIARWAANGSLFTSSKPQEHIPGEGAVGLLITNRVNLADTATIALVDAFEVGRRDVSADESRRSDPKLLGELSERVLKRAGIGAFDVATLVSDTGHRSSRGFELMSHVSAMLPQLEEAGDVVRVGVASGTCDAVPFMTALALGSHYAVARNAPVLCVSNEDPYHRVVALVRS